MRLRGFRYCQIFQFSLKLGFCNKEKNIVGVDADNFDGVERVLSHILPELVIIVSAL